MVLFEVFLLLFQMIRNQKSQKVIYSILWLINLSISAKIQYSKQYFVCGKNGRLKCECLGPDPRVSLSQCGLGRSGACGNIFFREQKKIRKFSSDLVSKHTLRRRVNCCSKRTQYCFYAERSET